MEFVLFASVSSVASAFGAAVSHAAPFFDVITFVGEIPSVMMSATCFASGLLGVAWLASASR